MGPPCAADQEASRRISSAGRHRLAAGRVETGERAERKSDLVGRGAFSVTLTDLTWEEVAPEERYFLLPPCLSFLLFDGGNAGTAEG
jgi:hypothetical protein